MKALWPIHKATLEQVHPKATVAVAAGIALERLWLTKFHLEQVDL